MSDDLSINQGSSSGDKKKKKMDLEAHNTESANRLDIKVLLEF